MAMIASIMLTTHLAMPVHPGGNGLQTCINSGSVSCELLPGIHRESVTIPTFSRPVEIIGMRGSVLSGAEPIPDSSWRKHDGSIYKAKLPDSVLGSDIQQAWMGEQVCFEARWPNTNLTHGNRANEVGGPLDAEGSWARTYGIIGQNDSCLNCTRLRQGIIVDPKLAQTGIDWTGATATLNVGFRFLTWTRTVLNHSAGSATFTYNKTTQKSRRGMVGGSGAYLDKGLDNLYFLSGKLAALDAPGEFFVDHDAGIMYLWPTSSSQPAEPPTNVTVKVRNYCVQGRANLTGVRFHGCAFWLKGNGLRVTDTELLYPTYHRAIGMRSPDGRGAVPPVPTLQGNDSVVRNFTVRYSQGGGLKVVGSRNVVEEALLEDSSWLGSLDFPVIELGFGFTQPTADARGFTQPTVDGLGAVFKDSLGGGGDTTLGNDNIVRRATLRRFSSMGILTSQRSNEIALVHVHDGGLVGLDSACLHADNTFVSCMNASLPAGQRVNCSKVWHHSWVHDCREKGVRGDDRNLNLTVHHMVVWNLGEGRDGFDRNDSPSWFPKGHGAATGVIMKGDYNRFYHNTVFNTSAWGQGDLCATSKPLRLPGWFMHQQNAHSLFLNSATTTVTGQGGPTASSQPPAQYAAWAGMTWPKHTYRQRDLQLRDVARMDFRPTNNSPLRGSGVVHPPFVPPRPDGRAPDAGAYQSDCVDGDYWVPGCTFSSACSDSFADDRWWSQQL